MTSPPGQARYGFGCPVDDCDWVLPMDPAPTRVYQIRTDLPMPQAIDEAVTTTALEENRKREAVLREHFASHDVLDFLRTIRRLELALAQYTSGVRPHRHDH